MPMLRATAQTILGRQSAGHARHTCEHKLMGALKAALPVSMLSDEFDAPAKKEPPPSAPLFRQRVYRRPSATVGDIKSSGLELAVFLPRLNGEFGPINH